MKHKALKNFALGLVLSSFCVSWALAQDSAAAADLPSAESILDRFVEVTGGDTYRNLTSAVAQGTMAIAAAGITGQLEVSIEPGKYSMHVELPGIGNIDSGVVDGVAWENSALTGPRILEGAEAELAVVGAHPGASAYWRDMYATYETVGVEDVNGEAAYSVALATRGGFEMTNSYSIDSGLLLKQAFVISTQGIQLPMQQFHENYTESQGITSAQRIVIDQGVGTVVLTFTGGEYNVDIPAERFEIPEAVQAIMQ